MYFFFDYIYYRSARLMFKRDGKLAGTTVVLVSAMQTFLIALIVHPIYKHSVTADSMALNSKKVGWIAGAIYITLFIINFVRHSGQYETYKLRWENESPQTKNIRGILVVISLFLPMIVYGFIG